jgi:hypothetical protein
MPMTVLVLPILPDMEENWRRFTQDLLEVRLGEYEALGRHMGIRRVRVYLASGCPVGTRSWLTWRR